MAPPPPPPPVAAPPPSAPAPEPAYELPAPLLEPHVGPAEPAPFAAPPPLPDEAVFDVQVELDAGPFPDFASLSTFERSLARLPRVDDVYVRRLADDRALIELTLSEPTPLLATMRGALPYDVEVRSSSRNNLVIDVLASSPAAR